MTSVKHYVNLINKYDRVIVLVDMDCFYCQVVEKLDKSLAGKPIAVVQYNEWKGGGIIAVNYIARSKGVTRLMRGDDAKEHCPEIQLVKVPVMHGKADLTMFRAAGAEVAAVLQSFTPLLERASIDEAYLDITERVNNRIKELNQGTFKLHASKFQSTYAVGYSTMEEFFNSMRSNSDLGHSLENESEHEIAARKKSALKLLIGATVVNEIRAAVKEKTGYSCSAGIAHNKIMAKLTAGMNKPNKQTVLPLASIPNFFNSLPVSKVKGLGGKFGQEVCEIFKVKNIGELVTVPKNELIKQFGEKNGDWLYLICRGIDLESVTPRYCPKSIGCSKQFFGANAITGIASLQHWLGELSSEICERMEKDQLENHRTAKQMTISYLQTIGKEDVSSTRSAPLNHHDSESIAKEALEVLKRNIQPLFRPGSNGVLMNPIKYLGISVGKFQDNVVDTERKTEIQNVFNNPLKTDPTAKPDTPKLGVLSIFESTKKPQFKISKAKKQKTKTVPEKTATKSRDFNSTKKSSPSLKKFFERKTVAPEANNRTKVQENETKNIPKASDCAFSLSPILPSQTSRVTSNNFINDGSDAESKPSTPKEGTLFRFATSTQLTGARELDAQDLRLQDTQNHEVRLQDTQDYEGRPQDTQDHEAQLQGKLSQNQPKAIASGHKPSQRKMRPLEAFLKKHLEEQAAKKAQEGTLTEPLEKR